MIYKGYRVYPCGEHYMIEIDGVVVDDSSSEAQAKELIDERLGDE